MSKSLLSKAMTLLSLVLLVSALHAQANDATADPMDQPSTNPQATSTSKVRIVRLSMVKGAVEINRDGTRGFEKAIANLPVVERNQIRTGVGIAEVEFEDNSSLRLTPNTEVEFPELGRTASGATASSVHVIQGTVYVSLMKPQSSKAPVNEFSLVFGNRKLALEPASHVRLDVDRGLSKLAVLDGSVQVDGATGAMTVAKKKTATFTMLTPDEPKIAGGIDKTEFDGWDHDATSYHSKAASVMSSNSPYAFNSPYSYGLSDMMYYGSFTSGCGGGMMWRPYFASAAWDPFANGTWAWYPDAGYSWVSPYPWGWTAFHSGSWNYCPGAGWGWQPSNSWNGLRNTAAVTVPNKPTGLRPPLARPHPLGATMIPVNQRPLVVSNLNKDSFVFRKDSAGLGVPRGTFGKLDHISTDVNHHGSVERGVSFPSEGNRGAQGNTAASATNHGNTGSHTMPATGHSSMPTHSAPSGGSMGSAAHSAPAMSSGSFGGGGRSMGGGGAVGGGSASSGGHH